MNGPDKSDGLLPSVSQDRQCRINYRMPMQKPAGDHSHSRAPQHDDFYPAQSKAMCCSNKLAHVMYVCADMLYTQHTQPAVAQHTQADSPWHLSGNVPKEKPNSFNRGRALNGRLISACVFIS